jgi:hypothetical protein
MNGCVFDTGDTSSLDGETLSGISLRRSSDSLLDGKGRRVSPPLSLFAVSFISREWPGSESGLELKRPVAHRAADDTRRHFHPCSSVTRWGLGLLLNLGDDGSNKRSAGNSNEFHHLLGDSFPEVVKQLYSAAYRVHHSEPPNIARREETCRCILQTVHGEAEGRANKDSDPISFSLFMPQVPCLHKFARLFPVPQAIDGQPCTSPYAVPIPFQPPYTSYTYASAGRPAQNSHQDRVR